MKIGDIVYFNTEGIRGKGIVARVLNDTPNYNCLVYLLGKLENTGHDGDMNNSHRNSYYYVDGELTDNRLWGKY